MCREKYTLVKGSVFFGNPAKGARTQLRARTHTRRQPTQVEKEPANARRKPTQVEWKPAHAGRGRVPKVRTLGSQGRIGTPYHLGI